MSAKPDKAVVKVGPTWDQFLLVRFDDENGNGIAGIANWAAHPCVVCSQNVSADYPGELRRRLSESFDIPFLYLQGACANINLPFRNMNRQEMMEDVNADHAPIVQSRMASGRRSRAFHGALPRCPPVLRASP